VLGGALLGLFSKTGPPSQHLQDDTTIVVRLVGNLFVVMTSLLLGLMLNSAKNTFETNNRNIRALATELILLDRTMRALGPEAEDARRHLVEYVQTALKEANVLEESPQAEACGRSGAPQGQCPDRKGHGDASQASLRRVSHKRQSAAYRTAARAPFRRLRSLFGGRRRKRRRPVRQRVEKSTPGISAASAV